MSLLDFIFPKRCVGCKAVGSYLCADCFSRVSFTSADFCSVCQRPTIGGLTHSSCKSTYEIDGIFASIVYAGVVKKLIRQFKYEPYLLDLRDILGELIFEGVIQKESFMQLLENKCVFTSIPLHSRRLRQRGYNQSQVLLEELLKRLKKDGQGDLAESSNCLERVKQTKPQFGLSQQERKVNIHGAFAVKEELRNALKGLKTVVLLDDIVTTGATFRESASVLKKAGVSHVYGVALAHGQ